MKPTRRNVWILVILISVVLMVLITIQFVLMQQAVDSRQRAFDENVMVTLNHVAQKLETLETLEKINELNNRNRTDVELVSTPRENDGQEKALNPDSTAVQPKTRVLMLADRLILDITASKSVRLTALDASGKELALILQEFMPKGRHEIPLDSTIRDRAHSVHLEVSGSSGDPGMDSRESTTLLLRPPSIMKREAMVDRVLDQYTAPYPSDILKRVDARLLDSVLRVTLENNGLPMDHVFGIMDGDSALLAVPAHGQDLLVRSPYRVRLYPNDLVAQNHDLVVAFPGRARIVLGRWIVLGLIIFMSILIISGCFIISFRSILEQKRLSVRLMEFINNMTHEFKTPISTIALTSEVLVRPDVMQDRKRLRKYSAILGDESRRMRRQVEKILEMAALESGDFELTLEPVDMHELIRQLLESMEIIVSSKDGHLTAGLSAQSFLIQGDGIHLSNVLRTILDNAIKYNRRTPEIRIETSNESGRLVVRIHDNGIGMKTDELRRIFDKYYRVSTGNVHDVKGFGLGLYYVKLIVEAHGGRVFATSKIGTGSVFTVIFPLVSSGRNGAEDSHAGARS